MNRQVLMKIILLIVSFYLPSTINAAQYNFRYSAPLKGHVKKGVIYSVHLTSKILRNCSDKCGDIRLFDENETEVPYVILTDERNEVVRRYTLKVLNYEEENNVSTITMEMPETYEDISIIDMKIEHRDFKKSIDLHGSNDKSKWDHIISDTIYDFSSQIDLRKTSIEFATSGYQYYRITLRDSKEILQDTEDLKLNYKDLQFSISGLSPQKIRIDSIVGKTGHEEDRSFTYEKQVFQQYSRIETKDGDTEIIVRAELPVSKISFDIWNTYYFRKIAVYVSDTGEKDSFRYVTSGNIYTFPVSGEMETKNYVELRQPMHTYYKFIITNGNNPALAIREIEFEWVQKYLLFVALSDSRNYSLRFGDPELKKPVYDLDNFINQDNWPNLESTRLATDNLIVNKDYTPKTSKERKQEIEKLILSAVIVSLVLIIGAWVYILMKKAGTRHK